MKCKDERVPLNREMSSPGINFEIGPYRRLVC